MYLCKMKYQVAASILTFVVGVAISWTVVFLMVAPVPETEPLPCRDCARLHLSSEIPTVRICELRENFDQYRGKLVQVHALFHHDAGQVTLIDIGCAPNSAIHAGLSDSCASCAGARKALTVYTGFGSWYDGTARVMVLGRVGRLENPTLFPDDNGFNIDCIETVAPLGNGVEERMKYRRGELLQFLYGPNPE